MRKIIIGAAIMAMATTAAAKMPAHIQAKVDAIKARVESKVEQKRPGVNKVRAAKGDMVLIHDGSKVIMIKEIDPLEEMSVPQSKTVFVGNAGQVNAEIKKLGLKE